MRLLPFEYAARNLARSPVRLALSIIGSVLVVMLVLAAALFVRGMERSLTGTGSDRNIILLAAGSEESLERSEIKATVPGLATAGIDGIRSELGVPFVSPEVYMSLAAAPTKEQVGKAQVVVRGVNAAGFLVHQQLRITEGRAPMSGRDEVMVGPFVSTRLGVPDEQLRVGGEMWFLGRAWKIVGRFDAPNTVMNAEVWTPLADLMVAAKRDTLSCVVVTLGGGEFADADAFAKSRLDLELVAVRESDYYKRLAAFYSPVRAMIWITAVLIALGGLFGGLNTMYAAFSARVREIGMLQSLGYTRLAVVVSLVQESVLAAATGALAAAAASFVLLDGITVRFSMGAFTLSLDAATLATGLAAGLTLGLVGALPPALRCLRMPISQALKAA